MTSTSLLAWPGTLHKDISTKALQYMNSAYATEDMKRAYNIYVSSAGDETTAANLLGDAARNFDNRQDLSYCGWWVFGCHSDSDWFLGIMQSAYTKLSHAVNVAYTSSKLNNDHPGYDYQKVLYEGQLSEDALLKDWLYNQNVSDDTLDTTFKNYTFEGRNYHESDVEDYQEVEHPPLDNAVRYWFNAAQAYATFTRIGYMCHGADAGVPQHARGTWAKNHPEFESHCKDNFSRLNLGRNSDIYSNIWRYDTQMRSDQIITKLAEHAYFSHSTVMHQSSSSVWDNSCKATVNSSIAMCATLYTKAINCLLGQDCEN